MTTSSGRRRARIAAANIICPRPTWESHLVGIRRAGRSRLAANPVRADAGRTSSVTEQPRLLSSRMRGWWPSITDFSTATEWPRERSSHAAAHQSSSEPPHGTPLALTIVKRIRTSVLRESLKFPFFAARFPGVPNERGCLRGKSHHGRWEEKIGVTAGHVVDFEASPCDRAPAPIGWDRGIVCTPEQGDPALIGDWPVRPSHFNCAVVHVLSPAPLGHRSETPMV